MARKVRISRLAVKKVLEEQTDQTVAPTSIPVSNESVDQWPKTSTVAT